MPIPRTSTRKPAGSRQKNKRSWIGPAIEKYVAWLDENRYAPRVVFAGVPTLVHFGNFAEQRGAKTWAELPPLWGTAPWILRPPRVGARRRSPVVPIALRAAIQGSFPQSARHAHAFVTFLTGRHFN